MNFGSYIGTPVIIVPEEYLIRPTQVKFPRSKKVRIQKKWRKDKSNFADRPGALMLAGKLYVSERMAGQIAKKVT